MEAHLSLMQQEASKVHNQLLQIWKSKEEEVIKEVLRQCLHREPVLEDAKRLCIGRDMGVLDRYKLAFDGQYIGDVVYNFPKDLGTNQKISIEFIPATN